MANALELQALLKTKLADYLQAISIRCDRVVIEIAAQDLKTVSYLLRDDVQCQFTSLMDVAGVDYSQYGLCEWETDQASNSGFSRGVEARTTAVAVTTQSQRPRYGVVYQLLSITHNHRLLMRTYAQGEPPMLDSVIEIWPSANWNEREVFDLYGVIFRDHPDLRRILTDYGFIGHPFRKDFPLSGQVEVRYDATTQRVVYEPVDITPRVLVPKVIRAEESALPAAAASDSIGK